MFGREAELSRDLACVWEGKSRGIWCEAARAGLGAIIGCVSVQSTYSGL